MSDPDRLQTEVESLRQQVEEFRLRELSDLRQALAEAKSDVAHYRSEAERNANLGRQIHAEGQAEITRLRERISMLEHTPNVRPRPAG